MNELKPDTHRRDCNNCQKVLLKGRFITCGLLLAEGDEDDAEMADGIASDFAQICSDYTPTILNEPK